MTYNIHIEKNESDVAYTCGNLHIYVYVNIQMSMQVKEWYKKKRGGAFIKQTKIEREYVIKMKHYALDTAKPAIQFFAFPS